MAEGEIRSECPFCHDTALGIKTREDKLYQVVCGSCDAHGPAWSPIEGAIYNWDRWKRSVIFTEKHVKDLIEDIQRVIGTYKHQDVGIPRLLNRCISALNNYGGLKDV